MVCQLAILGARSDRLASVPESPPLAYGPDLPRSLQAHGGSQRHVQGVARQVPRLPQTVERRSPVPLVGAEGVAGVGGETRRTDPRQVGPAARRGGAFWSCHSQVWRRSGVIGGDAEAREVLRLVIPQLRVKSDVGLVVVRRARSPMAGSVIVAGRPVTDTGAVRSTLRNLTPKKRGASKRAALTAP